jgi:hypothetical protein
MAKKRMIHRSLWKSENLAACDMTTRLLFIGIITNADDQGRLQSHPALLRSEIFPFDDIALKTIEHGLRLLEDQKSLICYTAGGKALVQVAHWWEYQQPSWAWPSDLPAPPGWTDRIRYRQKNKVITSNWPRDGTSASPKTSPEPAGVRSRRACPEASPEPAGGRGRRASTRPPASEPASAPTPPEVDAKPPSAPPGSSASGRPSRVHGEVSPGPAAGPTLSPPVGPAPSGSGSTSGSTSGRNSKSSPPRKKGRAGPAPPDPNPPDENIYHALLAFGVDGAAGIAATYNGDDILAWLRYAKEKRDDLANPQGLVVRRLQQGRKPPPAYYEDPEDWRRFTNGDYADYLETCPEPVLSEAEGPVEGTCPEVPPEFVEGLVEGLVEGD